MKVTPLPETAGLSVVTPTFRRPNEVLELIRNLENQSLLPDELILVDGNPPGEDATERIVGPLKPSLPFHLNYIRRGGGTAVQRNAGIDAARGRFVALIDDDIRLEPDFFERILDVFESDEEKQIGGVTGCISNQRVDPATSSRWRWYARLKLLKTFDPGHYDFQTGVPVNRYLQPPHETLRRLDFMGAGCAVWRSEVFQSGLRFDAFFLGYGMLEDAHLALRASRNWKLFEHGKARCVHLHSPSGRIDSRQIGYKSVVNYYYVFRDIAGPLTLKQQLRFWRYQTFEIFRILTSAVRRRRISDLMDFFGRIAGMIAVARGLATTSHNEKTGIGHSR
ncbi:MAG: glycosyltransferase family 2 protein [Acidobacteriota bacterium]|nr:MAG: glycosyltransferase family 2 protein [Acidobacteriota bacterium]